MIEFSIPGFESQNNINVVLFELMKNYPNKFYDDIAVTSCYDSWSSIWNGGRCKNSYANVNDIKNTIKMYNSFGVSLRYTFTNSCLENSDLNDYFSNLILETTKNNQLIKTGININKKILKDYIYSNYGDSFYYIESTTKFNKNIEEINKISEKQLIVLDYSLNNDFDSLKRIKFPGNIELLCCEPCIDNCPNRLEHYTNISENQKLIATNAFVCPYGCENYDYYSTIGKRKHNITIDEIRNLYVPIGINKFKISGRTDYPYNLIENYVNYFVKKEYKDEIRLLLIKAIW